MIFNRFHISSFRTVFVHLYTYGSCTQKLIRKALLSERAGVLPWGCFSTPQKSAAFRGTLVFSKETNRKQRRIKFSKIFMDCFLNNNRFFENSIIDYLIVSYQFVQHLDTRLRVSLQTKQAEAPKNI